MLRIFIKIFRGFGHIHSSVSKFWMATIFAVYWLDSPRLRLGEAGWLSRPARPGKGVELEPLVIRQLANLKKEFFYLGLICVAIFIIAGMRSVFALRVAMRKEGDNWMPPAMSPLREKLEILVVTYIFILFLFGGRIYWQLRTTPGLGIIELFLPLSVLWAIAVFLPGLLLEYSLFTYLPNIYRGDAKKYRQFYMNIVRIMHIILLFILVAGTYWQYTLTFK